MQGSISLSSIWSMTRNLSSLITRLVQFTQFSVDILSLNTFRIKFTMFDGSSGARHTLIDPYDFYGIQYVEATVEQNSKGSPPKVFLGKGVL